jgi:CheY-like chemotaxis protein
VGDLQRAERLRIVVADDHPSIRENLRYLLNAEPDLEVVGSAKNGFEAIAWVRELRPDVLVLDGLMPDGPDGLAVLRELRRSEEPTRVVFYTLATELCDDARAAGAAACVAKDASYDLVVDAVRAAGVFLLAGHRRPARRTSDTGVALGAPRVLIVDDDPDTRDLVGSALADAGYDTRTVANGGQALVESDRWHPNVIVLDLMMPGMDGRAFIEAYRHFPERSARIIALSGLPRASQLARELGCDIGLSKPFDLQELVQAVAQLGTTSV